MHARHQAGRKNRRYRRSAWKLAIKLCVGKIDATDLVMDLERHVEEEGFSELAVSLREATRAGCQPITATPFDRILIA